MSLECELAGEVTGLLQQLGGEAGVEETLREVLEAVSKVSGCESVGIRWRAGEDFPYFLTRGFGQDFVVREGLLCERDAAGLMLRKPDGRPQLACMCGAVVQGQTDDALPFFTRGGSFWTNGTTEFIRDTPPSALAGIPTRNYCNDVGYESVALIPLRAGDETYGLLQLNSRSPGRFTAEQIGVYEGLAGEIAKAVAGKIDQSEGRAPRF